MTKATHSDELRAKITWRVRDALDIIKGALPPDDMCSTVDKGKHRSIFLHVTETFCENGFVGLSRNSFARIAIINEIVQKNFSKIDAIFYVSLTSSNYNCALNFDEKLVSVLADIGVIISIDTYHIPTMPPTG